MKSNITITAILGIAVVFLLSGCASNAKSNHKRQASKFGQVTKIERKHKGINAIKVSTVMDLVITQGNEEKVVVETNEELHQYVKTSMSGGTLNIRLETPRNMDGNNTLRMYIVVKDLNSLGMSGATSARISNFETNSLNINASGASDIKFSNLKAKTMKLDLSGATSLRGSLICDKITGAISGATSMYLTGSSNIANLTMSGASDMQCKNFIINELTIKASGASVVRTTVSEKINISAIGASSVIFYGNPAVGDLETSGASTVKRK